MSDEQLIKKIYDHEGNERYVYKDSLGNETIGIGRNIAARSGRGLSMDESLYLLKNDIIMCKKSLKNYDWYKCLDLVRKEVLIELLFNLGLTRFFSFKKMIGALQLKDYVKAANELIDSRWSMQVGINRSEDMYSRLLNGKYKED